MAFEEESAYDRPGNRWVCGDCHSMYEMTVDFCTRPWLDSAHLIVWNQANAVRGFISAQRDVYPVYFETVEALRVAA
jgi:hypothetical protein